MNDKNAERYTVAANFTRNCISHGRQHGKIGA